jgi:hypothetical protein
MAKAGGRELFSCSFVGDGGQGKGFRVRVRVRVWEKEQGRALCSAECFFFSVFWVVHF